MVKIYSFFNFPKTSFLLFRFTIVVAILCAAIFPGLEARAQTVVINTGTAGTPEYAVGPVYMSSTLFYRASRYGYLYTQAEMTTAGIPTGASITVVGWMKNNSAASLIGGIFRIYMKNSAATAYSNATETWTNINAGTTLVYQNLSQSIPATASPAYIPFTLTTPFTYTGGALEISVEWDATGTTGTLASGSFDWVWSTVPDRIYGNGGTTLSNTLSSTSNNTTINDRRPFIQITYTGGTAVTCAAPTVPTATGLTATSASLNWTQTGTPAQWQIKYGPTGFNVNTAGTSAFTPTKPYTLSPLTPATAYDYYVRAVCGPNDTSLWSPVTNFTTLAVPITCAAPTAPTATAVTATTASLNWTQTGTPGQWQIKYGPAGFNVNTAGTSIFTATKPYTLNPPLTPTTAYDYYVRAVCGANDTSLWSPVTNFTTACVAPTIVSKTDSFGCGPGAVVLKATASTGGSIKWYSALTGGTALFTGNVYTTPSIAATTTYYIAAAAGTCESTPRQAVIASVRPIPVVNIGNDTTICPGITYTMNAGNAGATYLWNTNATTQSITANTAGNYSVLVSLNGCNNSDARVITAGIVPQNNLAATLDLCEGDVATLNAGNSGSSFLWTPGGATTQTVNITTGGIKSVAIKSTTGCIINSSTNVTLRPLPVINLGNDTSICEGASITLDAGNPSNSYAWTPGGATTQTILASDSGTYEVTVTTAFNCESTDERHIAYLPSPRVEGFNFIPLFYEDLGKVKFTALNPTSVTSYLWDFGDGSATSTLVSPTHTYPATGSYTAKLKVFNGCSEYETSLLINVDLITGIVTLDKDEANIVLYPNPSSNVLTIDNRSVNLKLQEVTIFNTLGAVVYKGKLSGNREQVQVSQLASGIYSMRILTDKGFVVRKFEVRP
jgi:hypothetical protein